MNQGKANKKRLTAELDALCSQICRDRWGHRCAICGGPANQVHHFWGKRSCGVLRFELDNLLAVCFACHIRKIHQQGLTEPARDALIQKIGLERFEELKARVHDVQKITMGCLEETKARLEAIKRAGIEAPPG